jgi:hypothetical protein
MFPSVGRSDSWKRHQIDLVTAGGPRPLGEHMDVILPDQLPGFLSEKDRATAPAGPALAPGGIARFSQQLRALSSLNARLICMDSDEPVYGEMVDGVGRVLNSDVCALFLRAPMAPQLILEGVSGMEMPGHDRVIGLEEQHRPNSPFRVHKR